MERLACAILRVVENAEARLGCYVTPGLGGGVVTDKVGGGDWRWVQ